MIHHLRSCFDPHAFVIAKTAGVPTPALTRRDAMLCVGTLSISLIIAALSVLPYRHFTWSIFNLPNQTQPFQFALSLFLHLTPFAIAATSASMASHHTRSEHYRLLALTNVSGRALLQGLWIAALHKSRAVIVIAAALIPAFIVMRISQFVADAPSSVSSYDVTWVMLGEMEVFARIRLLGAALFGALVGVLAGIRFSHAQSILSAGTLVLVYYVLHLVLIGGAMMAIALANLFFRGVNEQVGSIVSGYLGLVLFMSLMLIPYAAVVVELHAPRLFRYDAPTVALPGAQG